MAQISFGDFSKFQGVISWKTYCASRDVAIVRAHNGYVIDPYFVANRTQAHANGIKVLGMYQYVTHDVDFAQQAEDLLDVVGHLSANEFLVADIEDSGISNFSAAATAWLPVIEKATGRHATVYTGDEHVPALLTAIGTRPKWVARYRSTPPDNPHDFWQHSESATNPGVNGKSDESYYTGTLSDFQKLVTGSAPTSPTGSLTSWMLANEAKARSALRSGWM